jgi:ribosomal protein L10
MEPVPTAIAVHNEHPNEVTAAIMDPLFNAAGKVCHLDAVVVKQEAGWFQLQEEKLQKKTAMKLAL